MANTPAQEEFLAITRKSQEAVIAAIKTWVEAVRTATPKLAPLTDKLPKVPSFGVPLADRLPGPEETVANAYRLAEQVLASQRKFAEDLLKLMTPLIPAHVESSQVSPSPESAPASRAPEGLAASPTAKSTPASSAPTSTAKSTPKGTSARPAAKSTPKRAAAKSTAGKSTAGKNTAGKNTAGKNTAGKSTENSTPARPAPKGTPAS